MRCGDKDVVREGCGRSGRNNETIGRWLGGEGGSGSVRMGNGCHVEYKRECVNMSSLFSGVPIPLIANSYSSGIRSGIVIGLFLGVIAGKGGV